MPLDYNNYNSDFRKIVKKIKNERGNQCELCPAVGGDEHWKTGSKVVITTHHIDGDKRNDDKWNLLLCCQRCHLRLEKNETMKKRKSTIIARKSAQQQNLFA